MSPSFNSFGSNPSVSQLVWDTDLVIPAGKSIESASGEVGIVGDVSVSGGLSINDYPLTVLARQYSQSTTTNTLTLAYPTKAGCKLTGTITLRNTTSDAAIVAFFCNIRDYTGKLTTLPMHTPSVPSGETYEYDVSSISLPLYTSSVNFAGTSITSYNFGITPYQVIRLF